MPIKYIPGRHVTYTHFAAVQTHMLLTVHSQPKQVIITTVFIFRTLPEIIWGMGGGDGLVTFGTPPTSLFFLPPHPSLLINFTGPPILS